MNVEATHSFSNGAPSAKSDPNGFMQTIFFGYSKELQNMLLGVEIDYASQVVDGEFSNGNGLTSAGSTEIERLSSLRIIAGYR
ncbi:MAG: hypothetical protein AAF546_15520, partial [Verrucomicrobiota bacterium]